MIKGRISGTKSGHQTLLLGLSRTNTERLHDDKPIFISAAELVLLGFVSAGMDVLLIAGETEQDMARALGADPNLYTQECDLVAPPE